MRNRVSLVTVGLLAVALAASPVAATTTISIGDNDYSPATAGVSRGTQVVWRNDGDVPHTVTSKGTLGLLDSEAIESGSAYQKTLKAAGTYGYFCEFHGAGDQSGTVRVPLAVARSGSTVTITVASGATSGYRSLIHARKGTSGTWRLVGYATTTKSWTLPSRGTWYFRARLEKSSNSSARSGWSALKSLTW